MKKWLGLLPVVSLMAWAGWHPTQDAMDQALKDGLSHPVASSCGSVLTIDQNDNLILCGSMVAVHFEGTSFGLSAAHVMKSVQENGKGWVSLVPDIYGNYWDVKDTLQRKSKSFSSVTRSITGITFDEGDKNDMVLLRWDQPFSKRNSASLWPDDDFKKMTQCLDKGDKKKGVLCGYGDGVVVTEFQKDKRPHSDLKTMHYPVEGAALRQIYTQIKGRGHAYQRAVMPIEWSAWWPTDKKMASFMTFGGSFSSALPLSSGGGGFTEANQLAGIVSYSWPFEPLSPHTCGTGFTPVNPSYIKCLLEGPLLSL